MYVYMITLGSGVHVQIMQNCCIGTYMAMWFAASIPITYIWHFSPCYPSPTSLLYTVPPYSPPTHHSVWCSPPCVHVFSLFNIRLWVRTCGSVCWEWWFPDSSMSLWRTWTHRFLWLHSIPWCICATFSLSSLLLMHIWVGSRSLLL